MQPISRFDESRNQWSINATEKLFPLIAETVFQAKEIRFTWNPIYGIDRMDTQYGVDAILITPRRQVSVAIRIRGASYFKYRDVTIRYQSLYTLGRILEMEKAIARFCVYGWVDTDRPANGESPKPPSHWKAWYVLWFQEMVDYWQRGLLKAKDEKPNKDPSSTFLPFSLDDIEALGLIYQYEDTRKKRQTFRRIGTPGKQIGLI